MMPENSIRPGIATYLQNARRRWLNKIIGLREQRDALLAVAQEIANDSRCDLVDSERRIRLYAAITKAGGAL